MQTRKSRAIAILAISGASLSITTTAPAQLSTQDLINHLTAAGYSDVTSNEQFSFFGVMRDFTASHPDFGLSAGIADEQYCGNISYFADADSKPAFTGGGSQIQTQWRNSSSQNIAPHLAQFAAFSPWPDGTGIYSTGYINMSQDTLIDSYDSSVGPYAVSKSNQALIGFQSTDLSDFTGSQNVTIDGKILIGPGGDTSQQIKDVPGVVIETLTEAPSPQPVQLPPDLGASKGDVIWKGNVTVTESFRAKKLVLEQNTDVLVDGHLQWIIDEEFKANQQGSIELTPGSTLEIYTIGTFGAVAQDFDFNVIGQDTSAVIIYNMSNKEVVFSQDLEFYGQVYSPNGMVTLQQDSQVFGRILSKELKIDQGCAVHIDNGISTPSTTVCGIAIKDQMGAYAGSHNGAIHDQFSFREWFRTVPGVNAAGVKHIELTHAGGGIFEHSTTDFTIADGQLLGNDVGNHNRYFTYEVTAIGQYSSCAGQFFEFTGEGDVWVTINDELVIDMGGQGNATQVAELDRLSMDDGDLFAFRFFYAQRKGTASPFSIRTNINFVFSDPGMPVSSALYD
ncbi:MAG: fibro-slime domain-containing protein [Phycisphaerales bacterium JB043]